MDLTIGQEEHKICYLLITVYLSNVRAVPVDLQARGLSHSLPELEGQCEKRNDLQILVQYKLTLLVNSLSYP